MQVLCAQLKAEHEAHLAALQEKSALEMQLQAEKEVSRAAAEEKVRRCLSLFLALVHRVSSPWSCREIPSQHPIFSWQSNATKTGKDKAPRNEKH